MLDQQQYETLLNILQGNSELTNAILTFASDNQLEHFIIDITNSINDENPEAFVETVLQDDGEVAKRLIDLVASNDQLKDSIINSIDDEKDKALANAVLQNNGEVVKKVIDLVASDQLRHLIIDSISKGLENAVSQNPKAFVDAVLQNNGEVAKKFIDLIASNDQLKDSIINEIDDQDFQKLVGTVLQNNGEVAKRAIDLAASDDQLKNAICDIDGKNPEKAGEKIMGVITRAIDDIESSRKFSTSLGKDTNQNKKAPVQSSNGGKPSTFLGKLNEYKGIIAISVLLTGGAVTAFVLEQPVIGAIAAVAAVIMVGILIREICKQQSATQESTLENTVRSVLDGTTLNPAAKLERQL